VLYEISNEPIGDAATAAWQNHMIGFLRGCQSGKPKRHPIGMTDGFKPDAETINAQLLASGADWISLAGVVPQDRVEPPEAPAGKVSLLDTDHVFGVGGDALWVWKAFVRGHNVLFMDALVGRGLGGLLLAGFDPDQVATQDSGRVGVAGTRAAAAMVGDMEGMAPLGPLCSTGRALADPGRAYVALATEPGPFTLDLAAAAGGRLRARWIAVATAAVVEHGTVLGGASAARFEPPFAPAALVLTRPPA